MTPFMQVAHAYKSKKATDEQLLEAALKLKPYVHKTMTVDDPRNIELEPDDDGTVRELYYVRGVLGGDKADELEKAWAANRKAAK